MATAAGELAPGMPVRGVSADSKFVAWYVFVMGVCACIFSFCMVLQNISDIAYINRSFCMHGI